MVWRPSGPSADPFRPHLAFKSGGFAWEVSHFLKRQATTEKEEEQVNELAISISPRKTHGLAAIRVSGWPLRDPCEAPLAFKSDGFAWEVSHFLKTQATTENEDEQLSELPISILPRKTHGLAAIRPFGRPSGPSAGPFRTPCEAPLAFKSGGFAWEVLHFLKIQATTETEEEQVNELAISISPRKTHGLAAIRPFGWPLSGPL